MKDSFTRRIESALYSVERARAERDEELAQDFGRAALELFRRQRVRQADAAITYLKRKADEWAALSPEEQARHEAQIAEWEATFAPRSTAA